MAERMTATKIMHDRLEWERRWTDVNADMTQRRRRVFEDMVAKVMDIVHKRVVAGWPTRDAAGDVEC